MDPELQNYIDRHRTWQDYSIKQMSFFNNLLIFISIGFIGFLTKDEALLTSISGKEIFIVFCLFLFLTVFSLIPILLKILLIISGILGFYLFKVQPLQDVIINVMPWWRSILFLMSTLFIILSIFYGLLTALSRLYDFRITRNTTLTRQRFYKWAVKKKMQNKTLSDCDFEKPNYCQRSQNIIRLLFCKLPLIKKKEVEFLKKDIILYLKFKDLRRLSSDLGFMSWRYLRLQVALLFLSLLLFVIQLFLNN